MKKKYWIYQELCTDYISSGALVLARIEKYGCATVGGAVGGATNNADKRWATPKVVDP